MTIASKFPGTGSKLFAREGATVRSVKCLFVSTIARYERKVEQAKQAAAAQEAQVQAAHSNLAVLNLDVPLAIEAADAQVARAKASVGKALSVERSAQ